MTGLDLRRCFGLGLLLLAACTPSIPEGAYACEQDAQCPGSWVCVSKRCYSSADSAAMHAMQAGNSGSGGNGAGASGSAATGNAASGGGASGNGGGGRGDGASGSGGDGASGSGGQPEPDSGDVPPETDAGTDAGEDMLPPQGCTDACAVGEECSDAANCASGACVDNACRPACTGTCDNGLDCVNHKDCKSDICSQGKCQSTCNGMCEAGDACEAAGDCTSNVCEAMKCRPACSGSCNLGDGCVANDDCTAQICKTETCRPACNGTCAVADACVADDDCASGVCSGGVCRLACAANKTCQPGDACASSDDCADSAGCDAKDKVCVKTCVAPAGSSGPELQIASLDDLEDWKWCKELQGKLNFTGNITTVPATAFPYLKKVTGDLFMAQSSTLTSITLSALTTVEGGVHVETSTAALTVSLPALATIGTLAAPKILSIAITQASRVEMPLLTTLYGDFLAAMNNTQRIDLRGLVTISGNATLQQMPELTSLNMSSLLSIGGNLTISTLLNLPASSVSHFDFVLVGGTVSEFTFIGCCLGISGGAVQRGCGNDPNAYSCQ